MKKYILSLLLLSFMAQPVLAYQAAPSKSFYAVTEIIHKSPEYAQTIIAAQDEASAFSFSDGTLRGPNLGQALQLIRSEKPRLQASDMDIAIAILQAN